MDIVQQLIKQVRALQQKRIYQRDIAPDEVKMRHVGEGVRFVRSGLAADRPTDGEEPLQGSAVWFSTDTKILSVWDGDAWVDYVRIPASPANYTVSNLTTDRTYDADSTSTAELADILGTLISDLTAMGILQ